MTGAVRFLISLRGEGSCSRAQPNGGTALTEPFLHIATLCNSGKARDLLLPHDSPEHRAEVDSWTDIAATFSDEHVASVDLHLRTRSFLAGGAFSLADVVIFFAFAEAVKTPSWDKFPHFARWFNLVQHRVRSMAPSCNALPPLVSLGIFVPVPVPLPTKRAAASSEATTTEGTAVTAGTAGDSLPDVAGDKPRAETGGLGEGAATGVAPGGGSSSKKDKKKNKKAAESEKGAAAGKGNGKEGEGAAAAAAASPSNEGDPSKLDVRVGVIVKAWEHPDSEKLFCEEIDLGEGKTRMIASGLRAFYSLDEMQGRRVIVLANLKARNIGGFKSEGMVLCASSADHSVVKLIEPPAAAAVGARATISGTEGDPATPPQMQKKKILEKCAPKLRTNADGIAGYEGVGVFQVDGVPCVATIPDAFVS